MKVPTLSRFVDANRVCQNYLGNLAHVRDYVVQKFIQQEYANLPVYIGLNDVIIESDFRWIISDEKLGWYKNWGPDQPADEFFFKDEDCVQMVTNGEWNDVSCDFVFSAVCETERTVRGWGKKERLPFKTSYSINLFTSEDNHVCKDGEFLCMSGNPVCVPAESVCDGSFDCQDQSDEYQFCSSNFAFDSSDVGNSTIVTCLSLAAIYHSYVSNQIVLCLIRINMERGRSSLSTWRYQFSYDH